MSTRNQFTKPYISFGFEFLKACGSSTRRAVPVENEEEEEEGLRGESGLHGMQFAWCANNSDYSARGVLNVCSIESSRVAATQRTRTDYCNCAAKFSHLRSETRN